MITLARTRADKEQAVEELVERFQSSKVVVLANYRGLNVDQMTTLRRRLREQGIEFRVVKNSMAERAASQVGLTGLSQFFIGPTAIAFSDDDLVAPAKVLAEFARESKILELKAGWLEGQLLDLPGVIALAELPSREVLLARVVGGIAAPLYGFATVVAAPIRQLMAVLNAVADKQQTNDAA